MGSFEQVDAASSILSSESDSDSFAVQTAARWDAFFPRRFHRFLFVQLWKKIDCLTAEDGRY